MRRKTNNLKKMLKIKASVPSVANEPLEQWMRNVRNYIQKTEPWQKLPSIDATPEEFADWFIEIRG